MLFVLCGSAVAAALAFRGSPGEAAALLVAFVLAIYRRVGGATPQRAADGRPVVYWRPGCKYCLRLRIRLGRGARQLHWVDVWRDPAGAAAVREANGGDETVPTVVVAGRPHTNPDPAWVARTAPAVS
ncbi:glutaredoxin domain-containing protein [Streptomyces echinatus]